LYALSRILFVFSFERDPHARCLQAFQKAKMLLFFYSVLMHLTVP
jgi:hypothetical protein